jgi:hypothetical protein
LKHFEALLKPFEALTCLLKRLSAFGDEGYGFAERTIFHRVCCDLGSDEKLGELDTCFDTTWTLPYETQATIPGHVIPCLPQLLVA